jgi:hypothetical protein
MDPLEAQLDAACSKAMTELATQSLEDVQRSTAITWAGRALASYIMFMQTGDIHRLLDASEYHHEALEHASLDTTNAHLYEMLVYQLGHAKARAMGGA